MGERLASVIDLRPRLPRCCPHCDGVVSPGELWQHVQVCPVLAERRGVTGGGFPEGA